MKNIKINQSGFTIVELMIATAVFSLVLMLCSMAIMHVGRMYYKGVITNRTQDAARRLAEDVASAIQFGAETSNPDQFHDTGSATHGSVLVESLCLGDVRYSYSRSHYVGEIEHVVWRDRRPDSSACDPLDITTPEPSLEGVEMLGRNMRVPNGINVPLVAGANEPWTVDVTVSYGDSADLFEDSTLSVCKGVIAGGQYCAVSRLNTSVLKRL